MAYLDFADQVVPALQTPPSPAAHAGREASAGFAALEWRVIDLARNDPLSSLQEDTRFRNFMRRFFGWYNSRPLGNSRLEALRRIAVMSWHHGYNVHHQDIEAFLGAGYSLDQYEVLLNHITEARTIPDRRAR